MQCSEEKTSENTGLLCAGPGNLPRVVLVDDVWFQPYFKRHHAFREKTFGDKDLVSFDDFQAALEAADTGDTTSKKFRFDVDLLVRLLERCRSGYQLCICSFERFSKGFPLDFDRTDTAILISMGHDPSGEVTFKGPELLSKSLKGFRPRAEVVFITGYPREFVQYMSRLWQDISQKSPDARQTRIGEARWWILRSFPVIEKYKDTLDAHLNGFFDFFGQRFRQDILQRLVTSLHLAQQLNPGVGLGGDPAHLRSLDLLEAWEQRNGGFPLASLFLEHDGDPSGAVESFKALFSMNLKARYQMSPRVLQKLLRMSGFELETSLKTPFHLPTCPGAIFVFGLIRFLIELREMPVRVELSSIDDRFELVVPLDMAKAFGDALETRNSGGAVCAFRDWLAGNTEPIKELEPKLTFNLRSWVESQTMQRDGHRPVWKKSFERKFFENSIAVTF